MPNIVASVLSIFLKSGLFWFLLPTAFDKQIDLRLLLTCSFQERIWAKGFIRSEFSTVKISFLSGQLNV